MWASEKRARTAASGGLASLRTLCLNVLLPDMIARGDRFALSRLGPDLCLRVFEMMRDAGKLTGDSMPLFMHSHLTRVDLEGYLNATQQFLDTLANLASSLSMLSLAECSKIVDFAPLAVCVQLEVLNVSGTKFNTKHLAHLRPLTRLSSLLMASTRITEVPSWLPEGLEQLDVANNEISDEKLVGRVRRLRALRYLNVSGTGVKVARFAPLKSLIALNLSNCSLLEPESLFWIAGCSRLKSLDLFRTSLVPGSALFQLRSLTQLEHLTLPPSSNLSDDTFGHLAPLCSLTSLKLARYPVSDLKFCKNLTQVTFIDLANCPVFDLRPLSHLESLAHLNLQDCANVSDVALPALTRLPRLAKLDVRHTKVTDNGCKTLGECASLTNLNLSYNDVGDAGLRSLITLTKLVFLDVTHTRVLWSDVTVLQNLPLLKIRSDPKPANAVGNEDNDDGNNGGGEGFVLGAE